MFYERTKPANARFDHHAVIRMRTYLTRQVEQRQRFFKVDRVGRPSFRQAGAIRLGLFFGCFAALNIGTIAAIAQANGVAVVMSKQLTLWADAGLFCSGRTKRTCVAAFGIVRTPDKRAARTGRAHRQTSGATVRAGPWVCALFVRREQVRLKHLVDLFKDVRDPQFGCFTNRRREITPEPAKQGLVFKIACRHLVQVVFKRRCEIVF